MRFNKQNIGDDSVILRHIERTIEHQEVHDQTPGFPLRILDALLLRAPYCPLWAKFTLDVLSHGDSERRTLYNINNFSPITLEGAVKGAMWKYIWLLNNEEKRELNIITRWMAETQVMRPLYLAELSDLLRAEQLPHDGGAVALGKRILKSVSLAPQFLRYTVNCVFT